MATNQVATRPSATLADVLNAEMANLQAIAPKYMNVQKLCMLAIEARQRNELLAECSAVSVLNFCKACAEMGTDRIGAGGMWPVPFKNNKTNRYDMVPMPDWRLLIEKAKKAKAIKHATAEAVYAGDEFSYERGLTPQLIHRPAVGRRGTVLTHVYCVYVLPDDTRDFHVMTMEECMHIRGKSKAKDGGPWALKPDGSLTHDAVQMCLKTVVKRTMKLFEGASIELTRLIDLDNQAVGYVQDLSHSRPIPPMPTALPPTASTGPVIEGEATDKQETSAPDGNTVRGIVQRVSVKAAKRGKRYGVLVGEVWYGTFSDDLGKAAEALKGKEAVLTVEQNGQFWNFTAISEAPAPQKEQEPAPPEAEETPRMREPGEDEDEDGQEALPL